MIKRIYKISLIIFLIVLIRAEGNDNKLIRITPASHYGVFANFNLNIHLAEFSELPEIENCCPKFNNGNGLGYGLGLLYEIPFTFVSGLSFKLGYANLDGKFESTEPKMIIVDNELSTALIKHTIETNISAITFEPALKYSPYYRFNLYAGLGGGIIVNKDFHQMETLVEPSDMGTFENGKRTRNEVTGILPLSSDLLFFFNLSAGYELPLNRIETLIAMPTLNISYGLNSLIAKTSTSNFWKTAVFGIGIAVKYTPGKGLSTPLEPSY